MSDIEQRAERVADDKQMRLCAHCDPAVPDGGERL